MKENLKGLLIILVFTALLICLFSVNSYASEYEYNVTDAAFGAIPNDDTDDYFGINEALKMARDIEDEVTVYVPAGEYLISDQLYIYSNTKLVLDNNAVIKSTSAVDTVSMIIGLNEDGTDDHGEYTRIHDVEISGGTWNRNSNSDVLSLIFVLNHGDGINIHDLTVEKSTEHMINVSASKNVTIKNVTFQNQIEYTGSNPEYWGEHTIGDKSRHAFSEALHTDFAGQGDKGAVPLDNTACQSITVDNCIFNNVLSGVGNHHETTHRASDITVKNCSFINLKYGASVDAWSFDNIVVKDNSLTGSDIAIRSVDSNGKMFYNLYAVTGTETDNPVISMENSNFEIGNNTIQNASKYAILISGGTHTINQNLIEGTSWAAIKANDIEQISINNNELRNSKKYGIFIKSCNGNTSIYHNTITASNSTSTGEVGIYVETCGNAVVDTNTVSGKFNNEIFLNAVTGEIKNNIVSSSKGDAVLAKDFNGKIEVNIVSNAAANGIHTTDSNVTISSNSLDNTNMYGIYTIGGTNPQILNNTISKAGEHGIRVNTPNGSVVSGNKVSKINKYGIFVSNSNNAVTVANNTVEGSNGNEVDWSTGIFTENCPSISINNNIVSFGKSAGIETHNCKGTISANKVSGCAGFGLQVRGDSAGDANSSFEINDNYFKTTTSGKNDLNILNSKNCRLRCNVFGNKKYGVGASATPYVFSEYTGLEKVCGTWYYFENGVVTWDKTTLVKYNGKWFYVVNNEVAWGANTLVKYNGKWYYINKGEIDWGFTSLYKFNGKWFYIRNGEIAWDANTLVKYNGKWYYINKGEIDWNYTGLFKYSGTWFYIEKGEIRWGTNTLVKYNGSWFYINNSMIDWGFKGLFQYGGQLFYIQNGMIDWGWNGTASYYGKTYTVRGGMAKL